MSRDIKHIYMCILKFNGKLTIEKETAWVVYPPLPGPYPPYNCTWPELCLATFIIPYILTKKK